VANLEKVSVSIRLLTSGFIIGSAESGQDSGVAVEMHTPVVLVALSDTSAILQLSISII
jgi:hypothetical protein